VCFPRKHTRSSSGSVETSPRGNQPEITAAGDDVLRDERLDIVLAPRPSSPKPINRRQIAGFGAAVRGGRSVGLRILCAM
jgi:hypothetical protein